jgi:hypothetical protein
MFQGPNQIGGVQMRKAVTRVSVRFASHGMPPPKCKWGRPEGRPHSHQRVDLPRKALGAQCLCRRVPIRGSGASGSVTGARTGIRFRRGFGSKLLEVEASCCWSRSVLRFRDRSFRYGLPLPVHPLRPKPSRLPPGRVTGRNRPMAALLRVLLKRPTLPWAEALLMGDLEDRADSCRHLDLV